PDDRLRGARCLDPLVHDPAGDRRLRVYLRGRGLRAVRRDFRPVAREAGDPDVRREAGLVWVRAPAPRPRWEPRTFPPAPGFPRAPPLPWRMSTAPPRVATRVSMVLGRVERRP